MSGIYDVAMFVKKDTLSMHLYELSKHFDIVSLDTLVVSSNSSRSMCAITFDDGWQDNYTHAYPILCEYKIPATIFITVNMIGTDKDFWFHCIWDLANTALIQSKEQLFFKYFSDSIKYDGEFLINEANINLLATKFKYVDPEKIDPLINNAYYQLDIQKNESNNLLKWENILEMNDNGINIGSHGMNHYILTEIDDDSKSHEIIESYDIINNKGIKVDSVFSYPNGNWDYKSIDYVKTAGYKGAVTTSLGFNDDDSNPFVLNRIPIHDEISNTPSLLWYRLFQCYISSLTKH
ncbi:MAG: polysaccharide deacetylase family protein [Gammaproteobacteria bacterium]|nr:polysaccharide deacetylase family protein [Gammaproteobacteria bacterium]